MAQIPNGLAGFFVHMAGDRSQRSVSAGLADRTAATDFYSASIPFDPGVLVDIAQFQLMTLKACITVAFGVILEIKAYPLGSGDTTC